jgi:cell fate regulator YaaT (PSP1 superfamily)
LCDIPESQQNTNYIEVQFKNARKGYYFNSEKIKFKKGDLVVVESTIGYDIGTVTLTSQLVLLQMKKRCRPNTEIKRVLRQANMVDIEKFKEAKDREYLTTIRSRELAKHLELQMKISYVEYQGDGSKATFYYIAEERIDFRQLIKDLAAAFHIRVEMRQIGVRQEAGQIGGIGSCGRELCCSGWMHKFVSVSTSVAQLQDISINTQKLAGQCTKLRCCLNYEVDTYIKAQKHFPSREIPLETRSDLYYCIKVDLLKNQMYYSSNVNNTTNVIAISPEKAFEIIHMNKKGHKPSTLETEQNKQSSNSCQDVLRGNLTRFDSFRKEK